MPRLGHGSKGVTGLLETALAGDRSYGGLSVGGRVTGEGFRLELSLGVGVAK